MLEQDSATHRSVLRAIIVAPGCRRDGGRGREWARDVVPLRQGPAVGSSWAGGQGLWVQEC